MKSHLRVLLPCFSLHAALNPLSWDLGKKKKNPLIKFQSLHPAALVIDGDTVDQGSDRAVSVRRTESGSEPRPSLTPEPYKPQDFPSYPQGSKERHGHLPTSSQGSSWRCQPHMATQITEEQRGAMRAEQVGLQKPQPWGPCWVPMAKARSSTGLLSSL